MSQSHTQMANGTSSGEVPTSPLDLTLAILGCGTMGIAILSGILKTLAKSESAPEIADRPRSLPTRFIACVRKRPGAGDRIREELQPFLSQIEILEDQNSRGVERAQIVILACKPRAVRDLLGEPGVRRHLKGKILVSVCAGISQSHLEEWCYYDGRGKVPIDERPSQIVRVMPNTAAMIGQSATVIGTTAAPFSAEVASALESIFSCIGKVYYLPTEKMDACTALCGSGPAFLAVICDALADGAVNKGIPRKEAIAMSAQVMKGTAEMILEGEHPAILKDKVCTPAGCTIGGLMELEDGKVRSAVSKAVDRATTLARGLG